MAIKTIKVKGDGITLEGISSGVVSPGEVVSVTSAASDTFIRHAVVGGNVAPILIALEDENQGSEIGTNYATAVQMFVWAPLSGSIFYGLISNGQSVTKGGLVMSDGAGRLDAYVAQAETIGADSSGNITTIAPNRIIGVALDTVDMSSSSAADPSGRCRILVR